MNREMLIYNRNGLVSDHDSTAIVLTKWEIIVLWNEKEATKKCLYREVGIHAVEIYSNRKTA
ncbi:unnamed protein product [Brugia timori]|uniref:Endo/exonuclease/phosphatase domain-containing protein n=1 Tax=Brugia timori TaxID=42155 RepID=A0A0R3QBM3_9BILA|nr:unnamed protein product [Brugia timori]